MYESQVSKDKVDVERLSHWSRELIKKYFLQKKTEMSVKEERALIKMMARSLAWPDHFFSVFRWGGGKKGLDQFTGHTRLSTFRCVNSLTSSLHMFTVANCTNSTRTRGITIPKFSLAWPVSLATKD